MAGSYILALQPDSLCRLHRLLFVSAMPRVVKQFDELRLEAVLHRDLGEGGGHPCDHMAP